LPLPPGRCYRLATFSVNGVRQQHTKDPFGNDNEQVNYSRVPNATSLMGPETKWIGFHDGSRIYEQSQRPLYHSSGKRLYSSAAHRSQHGNEQPNEIIPSYCHSARQGRLQLVVCTLLVLMVLSMGH
jgi:hypothetical protein